MLLSSNCCNNARVLIGKTVREQGNCGQHNSLLCVNFDFGCMDTVFTVICSLLVATIRPSNVVGDPMVCSYIIFGILSYGLINSLTWNKCPGKLQIGLTLL